ncbi:subunit 11 of transcription initiation factor IID [Hamiltosporidium magnivora]|uniref:Subunit 11 of transcription initiation factor IID n=1 Tax=Hamiltosporidium magnivora TaxID=148818 RepID=A0A4Q9KUF5_9MICR|nr:subunit 11 of transcription initiation factor IID [Hamiltosporidium magnivora]
MPSEDSNNINNEDINTSSTNEESSSTNIYPSRITKILDTFTDKEILRYESFRRSGFPKNMIRKFTNHTLKQACNPNFIIAISGIAKVFVGEIVYEAKAVQSDLNEEGPLLPSHVHEAYRRLCNRCPNMQIYNKKRW